MSYRTADVLWAITALTHVWEVTPVVVVSCVGGSDEHVQIWHPDDYDSVDAVPYYIVTDEGASLHPDTNL